MGKSCFFIGSHDAPERIKELLEGSVELHIIDDGVTDFYVGQYGNFDKMAARTVIAAKEEHPYIRLFLVNPYPFGKKQELPKGFDSFFYPEGLEQVPKRYAIARANRWMVSWVDHLISYADNPAGNSRKLVEWGKHRMERGQLRCEDLYEAETLLLKPRNLCPEKTVLLTSCDDTVVPHRDDVEQAVLELIFDEFWVMILDLTTPFGQSAMEILLEQKRSRRSYVICGAAGRPAGQRKNIRDQYATETGYIGLCAMADCEYFRYNPGEVETSAGFVCSESGRISMKEAKELFHSALFSRGNMCYNLKQ